MTKINKAGPSKIRHTTDEWVTVPENNTVARRMALARFKLGDLGSRGGAGVRAVYLSGPPGIGKTHSIAVQESIWIARGLRPLRFQPRSKAELIDFFEQAKGRQPLIMEEADLLFRSKPMFEILKQATDPATPDGYDRINSIDGEKCLVTISLNVPIVVSTNMDLVGTVGWSKELLADREALFNRSPPVTVPDDPFALWEWSVYLALTSHLTREVRLRGVGAGKPRDESNPLTVQAKALDWFTRNVDRLRVISPRTLKAVAQFMGRAHRGDMPPLVLEEELSALLVDEARSGLPTMPTLDWPRLLTTMPKGEAVKLAA